MHPAFSVIFLTTLIGVGQGLFIAVFTAEYFNWIGLLNVEVDPMFYIIGGLVSLVFMAGGLLASFFHLGHPERAWRAASQWRTSWLSREVIALPAFMAIEFLYVLAHYLQFNEPTTIIIGIVGVIATFALFICTGMIYACLSFLREWASPLTIINFILFGLASGFIFATAYSAYANPAFVQTFGWFAVAFTVVVFITRSLSLSRNQKLKQKPKTTTQTAIGSHHTQVTQRSQGQMGGSYNTREFFHGKTEMFLKNMRGIFMVLVFPVPMILMGLGLSAGNPNLLLAAFVIQYVGLIAERWYFFAQVNHPQNLYYQTVS
ncbi:MAG: dimethyl sulfoxide reductase anchor subunit [Gammaproteobacteria bacterium]|nr:dimethyl sulfoxide reductase anchor subunit [Gammaproteobacteria bacterium]MDH5728637.1 dimethyl sulfoxide reductase anchor subunit [Gammaproteobacteria bacterium]